MTMDQKRERAERGILDYVAQAQKPQTQQQIRNGVVGDTRFIRAALTSLTRTGRVTCTGEGKRGKPCFYSPTDSGMEHIRQIDKPSSQYAPQVRVDIEEKLVCAPPTDADKTATNADKTSNFFVLPFDYRGAALLIRRASPYKESSPRLQAALLVAAFELGEKRGIPKDQAATWILGHTLQYYQRKAQVIDLLLDGTYADEEACDQSPGTSNGEHHNNPSNTEQTATAVPEARSIPSESICRPVGWAHRSGASAVTGIKTIAGIRTVWRFRR